MPLLTYVSPDCDVDLQREQMAQRLQRGQPYLRAGDARFEDFAERSGRAIQLAGVAVTFTVCLGTSAAFGALAPLIAQHPEQIATSRGAAMLALERLGVIPCVAGFGAKLGPPDVAVAARSKLYLDVQSAQEKLFQQLYKQ